MRRIAFRLQEAALGGLSRRAQDRIAELRRDIAPLPKARNVPAQLRPGVVLERRWHDRVYQVEVAADGFVFDGQIYGSLSAVAKAITGAKWNGRAFFGLPKEGA